MKIDRLMRTILMLLALVPVNAIASSAANHDSWIELRAGKKAYLADRNGGASWTYVCRNLQVWYDVSGAFEKNCAHWPVGSLVRIVEVVRGNKNPLEGVEIPALRVEAVHGRWEGWVTGLDLQPLIPPGTIITDTSEGDYKPQVFLHRNDLWVMGVQLRAQSVQLEVLEQLSDAGGAELYVRVLSGPKKGLVGWMLINYGTFISGTHISVDVFDFQR